eukprot:CAMPEP_0114344844 /NCGR_PEP_ID=MMETSP0101-20121206/11734_1 /TAXON_ID=38822 ORGANISM="Pteridomonas danica, Strain PT" /NCGR_SAMPLE_ID=MMETSP0101 /ASSEMBLY_ACC=CAM_ASM_000211 /LENGTH=329 /DNA_ID=CAMNT_0001480415 /DNA_START=21 /DNA_END=1010 /DNA_ORIENTATION=-
MAAMESTKAVLRTGSVMPLVGLGTWKIPKDITASSIVEAIKLGYRHLDCACDYGNEKQVGEGIRQAIDAGLVSREELWVTSKLWCTYHAKEHVPLAINKTLEDLGLSYVDLYLIHFPIALKFVPMETRYPPEWVHDPTSATPCMEYSKVPMFETWGAMENLVTTQKAKNIGVCNVTSAGLRDILSYAKIPPAVLQIERHPYLQQPKLLKMCQNENVFVVGFSPLGSGSYVELGGATVDDSPLQNPVIVNIAKDVNKTPAQVVLKWGVQSGAGIIPKSSNPKRLADNLDLFDFELSTEQMKEMSSLDQHRRFNDPGVFTTFMGSFCPIFD